MALNARQTALRDNYEALLLAYAAGVLDDAQRLIVGAHLMLTPEARRLVRMCETLGGALINTQCQPVAMKGNSLENVLSRLDLQGEEAPLPPHVEIPEEIDFLAPLFGTTSCRVKQASWHNAKPGLAHFDLPVKCRSQARCVKADRNVQMPHDTRHEIEITLVIEGSMSDECGRYRRGDLVVLDRSSPWMRTSCPNTGGIYMIVSSTERRNGIVNWLNRLFP